MPRPLAHPTRRRLLAGGAAALASLGCRRDRAPAPPDASGPRTIVHAGHVLAPDGRALLSDQVVVVEGDRIRSVEPQAGFVARPRDVVVDARDRFVIPGLVDAHGHPPDAEPDDAITMEQYLASCLSAGVTTVRSCRGTRGQLALRDRIAAGEVIGPRLFVGGLVDAGSADEGRAQVEGIAAAGYDFVKLMHCEGDGTYDAIAAAVAEAGLPFTGHVPAEVPLARALAARQSVEHLEAFRAAHRGGQTLASIAADTKRAGISVCPTQTFVERWWQLDGVHADAPHVRRMPAAQRERWAAWSDARRIPADEQAAARAVSHENLSIIAALHEGGVNLLASASHGPWIVPGWSMLDELRLFERAGIPRADVLATATCTPTEFITTQPPWGRIAPGHRADLLVLADDPLRELGALHDVVGVVLRGRWRA